MKYLKFSQTVATFLMAVVILMSSSFFPPFNLIADANQGNANQSKTLEEADKTYNDIHNLQPADPYAVEKGQRMAEDLGDSKDRPIGQTGLKNIKELAKNIPETAKEVRENFGLNRR